MKKRLRNTTRKLEIERNTIRQVSTYFLAKIAGGPGRNFEAAPPSGAPHCINTQR